MAYVAAPLKTNLPTAKNDTGRIAYCGPYVLSALTGFPISRCEHEINRARGVSEGTGIKGTTAIEVGAALAALGYEMTLKESFEHVERRQRPTLWSWMQKPRNAWIHYILAVHKGKEGHWILVKGVKMCDTFTQGQWEFVCDGPHRGAKIMEVFQVRVADRPRT